MKKKLILFNILICTGFLLFADEGPGRFSIETDPTTYFVEGCSLQLRLSSFLIEKLSLGIGAYQVTIPEFYMESNPDHAGKGWTAKVDAGMDMYVDYYFFDPVKGLFAGIGISVYEYEIARVGETNRFLSLVETGRVGYLWRPFNECFYIAPWVGYSINQTVSGSQTIQGETLNLPAGSFVGTLQVGLTF